MLESHFNYNPDWRSLATRIKMADISKTLLLATCLLTTFFQALDGFKKMPTVKKRDFSVELEHIQMIGTPKEYLGPDTKFFTTLYNDTTRVAAADIYVVKDIPENAMLSSTLSAMDKDNRWTTIMEKTYVLCDYMEQQTFIFKAIYANGNLTKDCPSKMGTYYFRNFLVDTNELPQQMEEMKWRMNYNVFNGDTKETFISFDVFAWSREIDDDE